MGIPTHRASILAGLVLAVFAPIAAAVSASEPGPGASPNPAESHAPSSAPTASDSEPALSVKIVKIDGSEHITALRAAAGNAEKTQAQPRDLGEGELLGTGDRIRTAAGVSVTLLYPDGSRVTVSPESEFALEGEEKGIAWSRLASGKVRGQVTHAPSGDTTAGTAGTTSRQLKFVIRTRSAVMGVRGTEFVMAMDAAQGAAQVHTLEGTVEVAQSETALLEGKGTAVAAGQFIEGTPSGLGPVQPFDIAAFLKGGASQPPVARAAEPVPAPSPSAAPAPAPTPAPSATPAPDADHTASGQSRPWHLLGFELGSLHVSPIDTLGIPAFSALTAHWAPTVPVPFVPFLALRGRIGGNLAGGPQGSGPFTVFEWELGAELSLFHTLFAEGSLGELMLSKPSHVRAGSQELRAGLLLSRDGLFNRVFLGIGNLHLDNQDFTAYRAGLGLSF